MENELHYNYVYFNTSYLPDYQYDSEEFNAICLRDAERMPGVRVIPCMMHYAPEFVRKLRHYTTRVDWHLRSLGTNFDRFWYPFFFRDDFSDKKPLCFVVSSESPIAYLRYLKKRYPDCKLVKLHRDLVKITYRIPEYTEDAMNEIFDLRMSYDAQEAETFGFPSFCEFESKIDVPIHKDYPLCDVFFAGKAKDRFPKILAAYDKLTAAGLKCEFYVTHLPLEQRVERDGITYLDSLMPFTQMLTKQVNARCMLDINQAGAIGFTTRFLEAVMYNKKIILDNPAVMESKFYNPAYVQYVEDMRDIDPEFVTKPCQVDYHYHNEFSPCHLIRQIDEELQKQTGVLY